MTRGLSHRVAGLCNLRGSDATKPLQISGWSRRGLKLRCLASYLAQMLAVYHRGLGDPRKVWVLDAMAEAPEPGEGEARLQMLASPIDPMDLLIARGLYPVGGAPPAIAGSEGVARVESVGAAVEGIKPGDQVAVPLRAGCWREQLTVTTKDLVVLPADSDPVQASMLRVNGLSAHALLDMAGLSPGQAIIQSPGGGGVGQYVIQLAAQRGIRTYNLVGEDEDSEYLLGLGATAIFPRRSLDRKVFPERAAIAFDGSGGAISAQLAERLEDGGCVICYGAMTRKAGQLGVTETVFRDISMRGFWLRRWSSARGRDRVHTDLQRLAKAGLHNRVAASYPLNEFPLALAHALSERGEGRRGRVILRMDR